MRRASAALDRAEDLATRAVARDPDLAEAHRSLAYVHYARPRQRLMRLELERGAQLSAGSPHSLVAAGLPMRLDGDPTEGLRRT